MRRTLIPIAVLSVLSVTGPNLAQESHQTGQVPGADSASATEALTCADLNEMAPEMASAFLRGYQYAQDTAGRSNDTGEAVATTSEASEEKTEVGVATGTGDPSLNGTTASGTMDVGSRAVLDSCFDAPSTPLNEALSGAFGNLD